MDLIKEVFQMKGALQEIIGLIMTIENLMHFYKKVQEI
jgi:hypothetical protein